MFALSSPSNLCYFNLKRLIAKGEVYGGWLLVPSSVRGLPQ